MYGLIGCVVAVFVLMFLVGSDGRHCGQVRDPDQAISACSHIIEKAASENSLSSSYFSKSLAYHNRGYAYYTKGDFSKATEDYSQAINMDPASAASYYNRGLSHMSEGKTPQAIEDFKKAISLGLSEDWAVTAKLLIEELMKTMEVA